MNLRDITVTWMDEREETYCGVSTQVHESVLHVYQYTSLTNTLTNEWHIPLANVRVWNPAGRRVRRRHRHAPPPGRVAGMTSASQVVARQMTLSGETLLLALEPLDDDEFFAENQNGFSAAWVTGHLACVADLFSSWFGGGTMLSSSFHQVFNDTGVTGAGPVSKAASVDRGIYPKEDLLLRFRQAAVKALRALEKFGTGQWDAPGPPGVPVTLLTGGAVWERLAVHTYWHCGELAGSMPRFSGTYTLNIQPHHLSVPPSA